MNLRTIGYWQLWFGGAVFGLSVAAMVTDGPFVVMVMVVLSPIMTILGVHNLSRH